MIFNNDLFHNKSTPFRCAAPSVQVNFIVNTSCFQATSQRRHAAKAIILGDTNKSLPRGRIRSVRESRQQSNASHKTPTESDRSTFRGWYIRSPTECEHIDTRYAHFWIVVWWPTSMMMRTMNNNNHHFYGKSQWRKKQSWGIAVRMLGTQLL